MVNIQINEEEVDAIVVDYLHRLINSLNEKSGINIFDLDDEKDAKEADDLIKAIRKVLSFISC